MVKHGLEDIHVYCYACADRDDRFDPKSLFRYLTVKEQQDEYMFIPYLVAKACLFDKARDHFIHVLTERTGLKVHS
jgi:hypothetical protein